MNDGFHMHVISCRDQVQGGRTATILLLKRVPNHLSDIHGLILFKLGTQIMNDGIYAHLTLFCDLIIDGRLAAIFVVHKYGLAPQFRTAKLLK